jgi:hypothetical protein
MGLANLLVLVLVPSTICGTDDGAGDKIDASKLEDQALQDAGTLQHGNNDSILTVVASIAEGQHCRIFIRSTYLIMNKIICNSSSLAPTS